MGKYFRKALHRSLWHYISYRKDVSLSARWIKPLKYAWTNGRRYTRQRNEWWWRHFSVYIGVRRRGTSRYVDFASFLKEFSPLRVMHCTAAAIHCTSSVPIARWVCSACVCMYQVSIDIFRSDIMFASYFLNAFIMLIMLQGIFRAVMMS